MSNLEASAEAYASLFLEQLDKTNDLQQENVFLKQQIEQLQRDKMQLMYKMKKNEEDMKFISEGRALKAEEAFWER